MTSAATLVIAITAHVAGSADDDKTFLYKSCSSSNKIARKSWRIMENHVENEENVA